MERTCVENGIDRARIALTPPPLPDDAFAHEIAAPPRHPRLLFAGRIVPQKGLESLVRALGAIAPDRRPSLDVAGSGDMRDVVGLAARHDVAIDYHGFRDTVQLRALIDACTAVAVPSLWAEPFGLIGIEAQARGRPAVAYDVGGIGEWLGGAGALVRVGDERSLARAIERVCAPSAWPAFARAAFAQSASFNLTAHVALLQRVLTSAPPKESVLCAS